MKRLLWVIAVAVMLSACNTLAGVGKDLKGLGQVIEEQAESAK